jgi:DNA repair protein RadC
MNQNTVLEAREFLATFLNQNPVISSYDQLIDYCHLVIRNPKREEFHVLYLDRKNRLIEDCHLNSGTIDHVTVYPREVLKQALLLDASAMILVHNHPSNDPTPGSQDLKMTRKIKSAADVFEITLHDHIIVGHTTEYSFRSHDKI